MINLNEYKELWFSKKDTLKNLSQNGSSYMTESDIIAVSFDKAKERYVREYHLKVVPKSNDALFQSKDHIFFVEFKDGNIGYELQKDGAFRLDNIERKIYDSLFLFCDMTNQHISDTRQYLTYILVYNYANSEKYIQENLSCDKEKLVPDEIPYSIDYEKIVKQVGKYTTKKNPDIFGLRARISTLYFSDLFFFEKEEFSAFLERLVIPSAVELSR